MTFGPSAIISATLFKFTQEAIAMGRFKQIDIRLGQLAEKELQGYWAKYGDGKDGISAGLLLAASVISETAKEHRIQGPDDSWLLFHDAVLKTQELFRQYQREAEMDAKLEALLEAETETAEIDRE